MTVPRSLYRDVLRDLAGEHADLDAIVAGVDDDNPPGASGRPNPDFEVAIVDTSSSDSRVFTGTITAPAL